MEQIDLQAFDVWPGSSPPSTSLRTQRSKAWMPATSAGMTQSMGLLSSVPLEVLDLALVLLRRPF